MRDTPGGRAGDFTADGVRLGGVYPFRHSMPQARLQSRLEESEDLRTDFPTRFLFERLRREMYGPEHQWAPASSSAFAEVIVQECVLSTGRILTEFPLKAYASFYQHGFATFLFWADLSDEAFNLAEISELAALARGTAERAARQKRARIALEWKRGIVRIENFIQFCNLLRSEVEDISGPQPPIEFTYPVIYVDFVRGCSNAAEILEKHGSALAGLANLWLDFETELLKRREVTTVLATDFHPFEYGATCCSPNCVVEAHADNLRQAADCYGLTLDQHHLEEHLMIAQQCEVPVAQYFVMRMFERELSALQMSTLGDQQGSALNPLRIFRLVRRAAKLSSLHAQMSASIGHFRNIYLTRKWYIRTAFETLRSVLGTPEVERSVDRKLAALRAEIEMTYSMLTTTLVVALTVLGVTFGLVQAVGAGEQLGLWDALLDALRRLRQLAARG